MLFRTKKTGEDDLEDLSAKGKTNISIYIPHFLPQRRKRWDLVKTLEEEDTSLN